MSSPEDSTRIPYSKGDIDDPLVIPTGIEFTPVNEDEARAAEQNPNAPHIPRAQWNAYLKLLQGQTNITPGVIENMISGLTPDLSSAIYRGLLARNKIMQNETRSGLMRKRKIGGFMLSLGEELTIADKENVTDWGVVIVDSQFNGHDKRGGEPKVYPATPNPNAHSFVSERRQANDENNVDQGRGTRRNENNAVSGPDLANLIMPENLDKLDIAMKQAVDEAVHRIKDERGVEKLPPEDFKRIARKARRQVLYDYLGGNPSDDVIGLVEDARRQRSAEREAARQQGGRNTHSNDRNNADRPQTQTNATSSQNQTANPHGKGNEREANRTRAKDNYELALMYLAGDLNRDGKQPPSMSPESLARKYALASTSYRDDIKAGVSRKEAEQKAFDVMLPTAIKHFKTLQARGFIAEDYIKIDPNDPANDTSVTGTRVLANKAQLQDELKQYRQSRPQ